MPKGKKSGDSGQDQTQQQSGNSPAEEGQQPQTTQTNDPPAGSGSGEGQDDFEVQPTEGAEEYSHPLLKGKNRTQVEETVRVLEAANREQGAQLSQLMASRTQPQQDQPATSPDDDVNNLLTNPRALLKELIDEAVAPFREDIRAGRAESDRERLRAEYEDFRVYEPLIDQLLVKQGLNAQEADRGTLEGAYFAARGYAAAKGITIPGAPAPTEGPTNQGGRAAAPPQHRPSGAPMPSQGGGRTEMRDLTENEERLRREYKMTKAEFLAYQDAESDEVLTVNVSEE